MRRLYVLLGMLVWGTPVFADTYTVRQGDNLTTIARQMNVPLHDLLRTNAPYLLGKYEVVCGRKSAAYRTSATRSGYFCNDAKGAKDPVHANTLVAGWVLNVPVVSASPEVSATVAAMPGRRVAFVVDATGSMSGNVQRMADEYRAAVQRQKELIGVWFFADGRVWKVQASQLTALPTRGAFENTHGALLEAQKEAPDAIYLFTDEVGDDWPSNGTFGRFAPILAHCLPRNGVGAFECETSLQRLVNATPGSRYVRGAGTARQPVAAAQPKDGVVPPVKRAPPPQAAPLPWQERVFGK